MTRVFIIHGAGGSPNGNWFPWLKQELEKIGFVVIVPTFPTPEGQNLKNWRKVMKTYTIEKEDIFVGHSISPAFILDLLERNAAKAAFLVAPFIRKINYKGEGLNFDVINSTFYKNFDWAKIKENCKHFFVFYSDNDPYVPIDRSEEVAEKLGVKPIIVKGAGHINAESGYTKFELLLEKIKKIL